MLETIRTCIESCTDVTYAKYFLEYVVRTQNTNIDLEFRHITLYNPNINVLDVCNLINRECKGLILNENVR